VTNTYYIQRGEKTHGPFTLEQIRTGVRAKKVSGEDVAATGSAGPWSPLRVVLPDLFVADPLGFDLLMQDPPPAPAPLVAVIYCRTCGQQNPADTIACDGCGVPPRKGRAFCGKCGNAIANAEAIMCVKCRTMLGEPAPTMQTVAPMAGQFGSTAVAAAGRATPAQIDAAVKSIKGSDKARDYFRRVFNEINEQGGGYKPSWNWYAFLFSVLYYLHHKVYVKALILFAIGFLVGPLIWVYAGLSFNYDFYLKTVKNKDLW
jgi:hypothetical protein